MRDGEPYRFFHKTIKDGPDIFDDHLHEPNTQMGQTGENDSEEEEMKMNETPETSDAGIDREDEQLHLADEPEAGDDNGVQAVEVGEGPETQPALAAGRTPAREGTRRVTLSAGITTPRKRPPCNW